MFLLFVGRLLDKNIHVKFEKDKFGNKIVLLYTNKNQIIASGSIASNSLYKISCKLTSNVPTSVNTVTLHEKLGHPCNTKIRQLMNTNNITNRYDSHNLRDVCETCVYAKMLKFLLIKRKNT